jgi:CheY-like chemotaxis protein
MTVPLEVDEAPAHEVAPVSLLAGKRVVAVDDNALNGRIIREQLLQLGARPVCLSDSAEALRLIAEFQASDDPCAAAVLDLQGLELAQALRAHPACVSLPLVLLTSSGQRGEARRSEEGGFNGYLVKPCPRDLLGAVIATAIAQMEAGTTGLVTRHTVIEARAPVEAAAPREATVRVLLAEDNPINQKVGEAMLHKLGAEVVIVPNGVEAVARAREGGFDLVLMDCQMPELDGYEATTQIRAWEQLQASPRLTIIAMTANAMSGDRERCLEAGMDDFMSKPVNLKVLGQALKRWATRAPLEAA